MSRVIIFIGAPGSGKGTQSASLSAQLGIPWLSTGDLLRAEARHTSNAAIELRHTLASGSLVADDLICAAVASPLRRKVPPNGLVLDGFPRTVHQAAYLDSLLADLGLPGPIVIHLEVSAAGLLPRLTGRRQCLKCGAVYNLHSRPSLRGPKCEVDGGTLAIRDDDRQSVILRRLETFRITAQPLFDYYRNADFHRIDGHRPADAIGSELLDIVTHSALSSSATLASATSSGVTSWI